MTLGTFTMKKFLTAIISIKIEKGRSTIDAVARRLSLPPIESRRVLSNLIRMGLVERRASVICATKLGRKKVKIVMTGGVFDIIHVGHIATLWAARKLGDMLVVIVARDIYVQRTKGKDPVNDESLRLGVLKNLKPVDAAILGDKNDIYKIVEEIEPDVIALGYDQRHKEEEIAKELLRRGLRAKVIRLKVRIPGAKTSNILSHVNYGSLTEKRS
ncbi:MAG: adenylyltransferase/cytidyltransferase family protein [Thermoproteota archaeon]